MNSGGIRVRFSHATQGGQRYRIQLEDALLDGHPKTKGLVEGGGAMVVDVCGQPNIGRSTPASLITRAGDEFPSYAVATPLRCDMQILHIQTRCPPPGGELIEVVHHLVCEGDVVFLDHTEVWTFKTGEKASNRFATLHEMKDGKITKWSDYWDVSTFVGQFPQWFLEEMAKHSQDDFS